MGSRPSTALPPVPPSSYPPDSHPLPLVASGVGQIAVPSTKVSIDKNSRGTTFGVEYRHDDPDQALATACRLFDALNTAYGNPYGAATPDKEDE